MKKYLILTIAVLAVLMYKNSARPQKERLLSETKHLELMGLRIEINVILDDHTGPDGPAQTNYIY